MKYRYVWLFFIGSLVLTSCRFYPEMPVYLTMYQSHLIEEARERVGKEDLCITPEYKELISEAETMLEMPCPSVMLKKHVPPSGNMHDYMSLGPYWWPDSTKENGLPYVRRDGLVNPEARNDNTDYLARKTMMDMVETLTMSYVFSGQKRFAEKAAICLRVWFIDKETKMNPHLRYAQAIPGLNHGRSIGIIETSSFGMVGDWATLLLSSPYWTKSDHQALKAWFETYLDWLIHSDYGIEEANWHNNHGTWFDVQAAAISQFLGNHDLAKSILSEVKVRRLDKHINPDGSQPHELERTKSLSYSVMNLKGFYHLAHMAEQEGIDLWNYHTLDNPGIKGATDFLVTNALKDTWSYQQLSGMENKKVDLVLILSLAKQVYEDKNYQEYLDEYANEICQKREALFLNAF